ncbi:phosphonate metabolism protein/1,5-bisphosphokinase (PRPP-forming) PhnN [Humitalea sp. 24SJ18S-53]|uniref:phosphonate metabolism protein/1,5-bisphosphokinase (PRPP-forming) PhnN n=1 Tax=Humitalea sp. 24SJ18S-53 TaxID=3422307 RepID=UPI003D674D92
MLIAVVGASGVGKDTLLDRSRVALQDDQRFRWARRVITRPAEAGGEDHDAVTEAEFLLRRFALSWSAHGLRYGITEADGAAALVGHRVVANLSRAILAEAATRFPLRVVNITLPDSLRAARLAARGREDVADIAARLSRVAPLPPGLNIIEIVNDGSAAEGAARLVAALTAEG